MSLLFGPRMDSKRPTVYIPNFNGGQLLVRALESLALQTRAADVVVIDNGSSDGSAALARATLPSVRVIELPENVGFGRAINLGVRTYPPESLVFVNNDVECKPEFIDALCDQLGGEAGMVAGVLLRADDPATIDSAGVTADRSLMGFDYLNGEPAKAAADAPPPLGPSGAAALFSLDAFNSVGGFDERIFAYYEDLDLALRLRRAGVACRLAAGARAVHHYSATLGAGSGPKHALTGWSRAYLLRRYGVMRQPHLTLHVLACETAICAGQLLRDRTAQGISGRIRGWQAARGLSRRPLLIEGLLPLSLRNALSRRARRRVNAEL